MAWGNISAHGPDISNLHSSTVIKRLSCVPGLALEPEPVRLVRRLDLVWHWTLCGPASHRAAGVGRLWCRQTGGSADGPTCPGHLRSPHAGGVGLTAGGVGRGEISCDMLPRSCVLGCCAIHRGARQPRRERPRDRPAAAISHSTARFLDSACVAGNRTQSVFSGLFVTAVSCGLLLDRTLHIHMYS